MTSSKGAKPNLSLKFLEGVTEKLREENEDLRKELGSLRGVVSSLKGELQTLQIIVSENIERREAVETNLVGIEQTCSDLQDTQAKMSSAIELQVQYSRKSTLLLTGRAIPAFKEGEHTRSSVVGLLKEYLGMDIHPRAITACHRLRNKGTILVRFADLDERMAVYRQRLSPRKQGLLVHESLTNERLAVIRILQRLHKTTDGSPFLSYFTSMGKIFIRLADSPKAKVVELAVGTTERDILTICERHRERRRTGGPTKAPSGRAAPKPRTTAPPVGTSQGLTNTEQGKGKQSAGSGPAGAGGGHPTSNHLSGKQDQTNNSHIRPSTSGVSQSGPPIPAVSSDSSVAPSGRATPGCIGEPVGDTGGEPCLASADGATGSQQPQPELEGSMPASDTQATPSRPAESDPRDNNAPHQDGAELGGDQPLETAK